MLLALGIAWAVGIPVLKLKGHYLAMATLGIGTIIYSIVLGTAALRRCRRDLERAALPGFSRRERKRRLFRARR